MEYLISARHGHYDDDSGSLTDKGMGQIEELARVVKEIVGESKICLLSTDAKRVVQTAEILEARLQISDYEKIPQENDTFRISQELVHRAYSAKGNLYSAMIFVSHECPAIDNARYLAEKIGFDKKIIHELNDTRLYEGHAVLLNLEKRTLQIIPQEKVISKRAVVRPAKIENLPF